MNEINLPKLHDNKHIVPGYSHNTNSEEAWETGIYRLKPTSH